MQPTPSRRYRILSVLGAGGFGTVYRAELITSGGLRREVALKVLNERAAANDQAAARLRDEARILSSLHHGGIVRVDDLVQLDGRWTMVMELVRGIDLDRLLETHGPLPVSVALELVESVSRTLHAATTARGPDGEELSLVHRDVKPANVLVTTAGITKLLDFGVARAKISDREAATQEAVVMGSLPYLAPERFGFEDLPAGDVYALGATFYEALTGRRFGRTRPSQNGHQEHLRDALHQGWELIAPEAREPVAQLLVRCLAFDPKERPTAKALASQCGELRRRVSGPSLADWAEQRVQAVLDKPQAQSTDPLCGAELSETPSGELSGPALSADREPSGRLRRPELALGVPITAANPVAAPPRPRPVTPSGGVAPSTEAVDDPITADLAAPAPLHSRPAAPPPAQSSSGWQVVALAGSLGLLIGVSVWLIASSIREPAAPVEPQPPNAGLTLTELAELEPGPAPGSEAPPEEPAPEEVAEDEAAPAPDAAVKAPKPKAKPRTAILVKGDAEFVQLVGAAGNTRPGTVAPGTYTLFPSFSGGYRVKGPTVTVAEGQTLSFECKSATRVCDAL
ncbi:serine/threonine protein kinase [Myxococcota bacterium]|nr:serine/threonine protein kinase [Myxococcota bacterium]